MPATVPLIVYRDVLLPSSEGFVPRMYCDFQRLQPIYLGARYGPARHLLRHETHRIADHVRTGRFGQALVRQLGIVPGTLRRWVEATGAGVLHAQFGRGGALALPIATACGLPLAVTFHGGDATKDKHFEPGLLPTIFQRRRAELIRRAGLILCVSEFVRQKLIERGFPPDKLRTHHLGVELPPVTAPHPTRPNGRLLFVGRFVEKKGLEDLIAAASAVRAAGQEIDVTLLGDGPLMPDIASKLANLDLKHRLPGWVGPDEVAREMAEADALVTPSRTAATGDAEGIPTVILEAQARGLPVIATRHAGIPEAIRHEQTGLLVDEGAPAAIAQMVLRLRAEPGLYRRIQEQAQESVRAKFEAGRQSRRLEALLLEIAKPEGRSALASQGAIANC